MTFFCKVGVCGVESLGLEVFVGHVFPCFHFCGEL